MIHVPQNGVAGNVRQQPSRKLAHYQHPRLQPAEPASYPRLYDLARPPPSPADLRRQPQLYLAHDDRQNVNFLFLLHQLRNNRSNFIEYLVPALKLTAIFRALHGFISNVGEFRLAVSEILKEGHIVRTGYGLMFDS